MFLSFLRLESAGVWFMVCRSHPLSKSFARWPSTSWRVSTLTFLFISFPLATSRPHPFLNNTSHLLLGFLFPHSFRNSRCSFVHWRNIRNYPAIFLEVLEHLLLGLILVVRVRIVSSIGDFFGIQLVFGILLFLDVLFLNLFSFFFQFSLALEGVQLLFDFAFRLLDQRVENNISATKAFLYFDQFKFETRT